MCPGRAFIEKITRILAVIKIYFFKATRDIKLENQFFRKTNTFKQDNTAFVFNT